MTMTNCRRGVLIPLEQVQSTVDPFDLSWCTEYFIHQVTEFKKELETISPSLLIDK